MLQTITKSQAVQISTWNYPKPYDVYNFEGTLEVINELLTEKYYTLEQDNCLFGFACFGNAAQIPCKEVDSYEQIDNILDIGLGLKPELCGKGNGKQLMKAIFEYIKTSTEVTTLRLSVACFNERAMKLYQGFDFKIIKKVTHKNTGIPFFIMTVPLES